MASETTPERIGDSSPVRSIAWIERATFMGWGQAIGVGSSGGGGLSIETPSPLDCRSRSFLSISLEPNTSSSSSSISESGAEKVFPELQNGN